MNLLNTKDYRTLMRKQIKICGLTRPQDVETALRYGADMFGFIVEANSPRRLSVREAARISRPAQGCAQRVAVTVNADAELLRRICADMRPDVLQLHGDESPEWLREVKRFTGLPIIKAVAVRDHRDLERAKTFKDCADYILLDAKAPKDEAQRGGHGLSFDWGLLKGFSAKIPLILAGGLNPDNIRAAKDTGFHFFDVSSGVEAAPGIKDHSLIRSFMKAIHE